MVTLSGVTSRNYSVCTSRASHIERALHFEAMREAIEATIEPDGTVRLLEPISLDRTRRALVVILDEGAGVAETALLSEAALADRDRAEEDAAWAHLKEAR